MIQVERRDEWRLAVSKKPVFVMPPKVGTQRVLSSICPHLGCQVEWAGDQRQFHCPYHGSVFAEDGSLVKGAGATWPRLPGQQDRAGTAYGPIPVFPLARAGSRSDRVSVPFGR